MNAGLYAKLECEQYSILANQIFEFCSSQSKLVLGRHGHEITNKGLEKYR